MGRQTSALVRGMNIRLGVTALPEVDLIDVYYSGATNIH